MKIANEYSASGCSVMSNMQTFERPCFCAFSGLPIANKRQKYPTDTASNGEEESVWTRSMQLQHASTPHLITCTSCAVLQLQFLAMYRCAFSVSPCGRSTENDKQHIARYLGCMHTDITNGTDAACKTIVLCQLVFDMLLPLHMQLPLLAMTCVHCLSCCRQGKLRLYKDIDNSDGQQSLNGQQISQ